MDVKGVINLLEYVKDQINNLEQDILQKINEENKKYLFSELNELTGVQFDAVIYINNSDVKYIPKQYKGDAKNIFIIKENEGYNVKEYKAESDDYGLFVNIIYYKKYEIPGYLVEVLKMLPGDEVTAVIYTDNSISKLYLLLKQGYRLVTTAS